MIFGLRRSSSAILSLLFLHLGRVAAQHNAPLQAPSPTTAAASSTIFLPPAALTSLVNPFDNDDPSSDNGNSNSHAVLNYYFLLLAAFIILIVVLYWVLVRKRKRRFAEAHNRAQDALAADLERWPGRRGPRGPFFTTRTGRWHVLRPTRPQQEGLNEHGEAPPAYVAKPEPAHSVGVLDDRGAPSSAGSLSPEWIEMAGKPPDYRERPHT